MIILTLDECYFFWKEAHDKLGFSFFGDYIDSLKRENNIFIY